MRLERGDYRSTPQVVSLANRVIEVARGTSRGEASCGYPANVSRVLPRRSRSIPTKPAEAARRDGVDRAG
ncbi:hypothetical protein I545_6947 [Mycobacterium kansasii 662]|uniref:Uncharacterized protein n=1 Tax=Mycobacterium kansasii 662 TaxID=1299326 RepID=X7XNP7_MYCKA|nr:hypothetical protein I545_6947 [Mycobacterium kansasii 662]